MGYRAYAGSAADFFADLRSDKTFIAQPFATATVYDDNGGRPVTDLLDSSNQAVTKITADSAGNFAFQAPDTYGTLWVKPTAAGSRYYPVQPARLADELRSYLSRIEDVESSTSSALSGVRGLTPQGGFRYLLVPLGDPGVPSVPVIDVRGVMTWLPVSSLGTSTGGTGGTGGGTTAGSATFASTFADARF